MNRFITALSAALLVLFLLAVVIFILGLIERLVCTICIP